MPACLAIYARASLGGVSPPHELLAGLLAEEAVSYQVYEGRDRDGTLHLLGFGGTGFVDPVALDTAVPVGDEDSGVFGAMWQAEERGRRTLLRPVEQGYANAAGTLHLAFLQYADVSSSSRDPLAAHIPGLSMQTIFAFRDGYSCERMFIELDRRDPRFDLLSRSLTIQGCRLLPSGPGADIPAFRTAPRRPGRLSVFVTQAIVPARPTALWAPSWRAAFAATGFAWLAGRRDCS